MSKAIDRVFELAYKKLEDAGISKDEEIFTVVVPIKDGSGVIIEKDTNEDGKADFKINLVGDMVLTEPLDVTFEDILGGR